MVILLVGFSELSFLLVPYIFYKAGWGVNVFELAIKFVSQQDLFEDD